jgi:hypothetical protein
LFGEQQTLWRQVCDCGVIQQPVELIVMLQCPEQLLIQLQFEGIGCACTIEQLQCVFGGQGCLVQFKPQHQPCECSR